MHWLGTVTQNWAWINSLENIYFFVYFIHLLRLYLSLSLSLNSFISCSLSVYLSLNLFLSHSSSLTSLSIISLFHTSPCLSLIALFVFFSLLCLSLLFLLLHLLPTLSVSLLLNIFLSLILPHFPSFYHFSLIFLLVYLSSHSLLYFTSLTHFSLSHFFVCHFSLSLSLTSLFVTFSKSFSYTSLFFFLFYFFFLSLFRYCCLMSFLTSLFPLPIKFTSLFSISLSLLTVILF